MRLLRQDGPWQAAKNVMLVVLVLNHSNLGCSVPKKQRETHIIRCKTIFGTSQRTAASAGRQQSHEKMCWSANDLAVKIFRNLQ